MNQPCDKWSMNVLNFLGKKFVSFFSLLKNLCHWEHELLHMFTAHLLHLLSLILLFQCNSFSWVGMVGAAFPHHHIRWPNIHLGYLLDCASCYSCMFLLYPSLCHRICHFTSILIFRLMFKENWNDTTMVNALFGDGRWVGYPFLCFFIGI